MRTSPGMKSRSARTTRSLVLTGIHTPAHWSAGDDWFNGGRADVWYSDEAVRVLLWLSECRRGDTGAARPNDPSREVRITLEEPVAGRAVSNSIKIKWVGCRAGSRWRAPPPPPPPI